MRFKKQTIRDVPVYELTGEIHGGKNSVALRQSICEHVVQNETDIVLDMTGVRAINNEGQNMLIANAEIVKKAGGRLAIVNIDNIESILAVSKLVRHLDYFDSKEEALESIAGTPSD